jgi:hypothetical protein
MQLGRWSLHHHGLAGVFVAAMGLRCLFLLRLIRQIVKFLDQRFA